MATKREKEPTFEEALAQIERIVAEVEEGKIGLDESVAKYEAGMKLIRFCQEKLNQVEKRLEMIDKSTRPSAPAEAASPADATNPADADP